MNSPIYSHKIWINSLNVAILWSWQFLSLLPFYVGTKFGITQARRVLYHYGTQSRVSLLHAMFAVLSVNLKSLFGSQLWFSGHWTGVCLYSQSYTTVGKWFHYRGAQKQTDETTSVPGSGKCWPQEASLLANPTVLWSWVHSHLGDPYSHNPLSESSCIITAEVFDILRFLLDLRMLHRSRCEGNEYSHLLRF